jgi:phosphoribosylpyrophosphate synthetase
MLVFSLDGDLSAAQKLAIALSTQLMESQSIVLGELELRHFPYGESYLAYMRQDKKFNPGESIPNRVIHATDLIADYIRHNIIKPLVIGPESEQWANAVAKRAGCDSIVLNKVRRGDHDVDVSLPQLEHYPDHQPILIDDIIFTGKTMIKAAENIISLNAKAPICIGVHGVFAAGALQDMEQVAIAKILTCNTIVHSTNAIDVTELLAAVIAIKNESRLSVGGE